MHGQIVVKTKEPTLLRRVKTLSYPAHGTGRLLIMHSGARHAGIYDDDFEYADGIGGGFARRSGSTREAPVEQVDDCTLFGRQPTDNSGLAIATVPM